VKSLAAATALCLCLSAAPTAAFSQPRTRRTSSTPQKKRAPTAKANPTQLNAARIKVADQIKKLTRFLYLYGRLSKDLELTSAQASSAEVTSQAKTSLVNSFRSLSAELDELEKQFRFTPGLERQYGQLQGVAQRAAEAEASATAGRFDQAGRTLVEVVTQLTDVLVEM
jgi:hypothetical protein